MPEVQLVGLFLEVEQQLANAEQAADSGNLPLGPTGLARRASSNFQAGPDQSSLSAVAEPHKNI